MKISIPRSGIVAAVLHIVVAAAVFAPLIGRVLERPARISSFAEVAFPNEVHSTEPLFQEDFISSNDSGAMVHSASIQQFPDGKLRTVWFQGSREGGNDVALYWSTLDPQTAGWSAPQLLINREEASMEIGRRLKTIGNPVFFTARSGRTWLFFVTVSLFGWSGGDVNYKYTDDSGRTWSPARRLLLTPVPHSGTLVKGSIVEYSDGSLGLPVYRSYDQYSFAEFARLASDGSVLATVTMSNGTRGALQPSVSVLDDHDAVAMMRYNGDDPKRVLRSVTADGGRTWSTPERTDLPNPDSAVATIELSDHSMLLVFNNSTQYRNVLSLARSVDSSRTWKILYSFDEDEASLEGVTDERSYPALTRDEHGNIQLVYTWKRRRIKHVVFNEAWVRKLDG